MRTIFEDKGVCPDALQPNIFFYCEMQFIHRARTPTSPSPVNAVRYAPYAHPRNLELDNRTRSFWFDCGSSDHYPSQCQDHKPFLVRNEYGEWGAPGNFEACYRWNSIKNHCEQCHREHICSLCGRDSHAARNCRLTRI